MLSKSLKVIYKIYLPILKFSINFSSSSNKFKKFSKFFETELFIKESFECNVVTC